MSEKLTKGFIKSKFDVKIISPDDGYQYFFGYYDLNAYHENGKYHLAHRVSFMDRLPVKDDVCELGYIDLETKEFTKFAETTAWNFQQGALLTYNGADYDEVFYNVRVGEDYSTCKHNLKTGEKTYTDKACACISPNGKYGLAVNFNRIYDFRPGYGYAGVKDKWFDVNQPDDDGIYLVDMETGKSKLIISIARMLKEFPNESFPDAKFVVNHITFNTSSDRFLFLLRNFWSGADARWKTSLITSDLEGNMYNRLPNTVVSHYHWKNPEQILFYGMVGDRAGIFLIDDKSDKFESYIEKGINKDLPEDSDAFRDLHCLYSPDRRYFIGDGYPRNNNNTRYMYLYDTKTGTTTEILKQYSVEVPDIETGDVRCDLHNRWNLDGTKISYDSTHNGRRQICELDVSSLK